MASAGASCCRAMLSLRLELTTCRVIRVSRAGPTLASSQARGYGGFGRNETWCRRWWNIYRKGLSTGTRTFTPSLSPMLSKEQQHYKEARETTEAKVATESKVGAKESKGAKTAKDSKETKESQKQAKEKSSAIMPPGKEKISRERKMQHLQPRKTLLVICEKKVTVEYHRGLPRITVPLPSRPEKCMFTLKPITQTVGDFLDIIKQEDPAVIDANITSTNGVRMGATNRIETMLLDDFNLIINDKVYPVSPPPPIEKPKENLRQLQDLQCLINQLYETFNAREYHVEMERQVMLQLEEVRIELEPLEQQLMALDEAAVRRSTYASWGVLVFMAMQFGCLARLTWWEYSWDIMEPVTYFVTYATAMGCYIYYLLTRQEYMLPEVFNRERLIGLHKKAKKIGFDLQRYNQLKEESYELEMMLRLIRGPLHMQQCIVEQRRRERLAQCQKSSSSSSSSSSRSPSSSPSPSPDRSVHDDAKKSETAAASKNYP
ncbi:calcium uniporter protein, mitochondrial isoform X2 [Nasonia vitripennis]|uniref:Calcium uniporter protein n=1 Tax=Nasonia vitripennis TaxID=7425 RepID=A0A7M7IMH9_NASVI|nr:calcium uniporter protein, mitochondrial isoform X2 [Nasonia vitripennis]